MSLASTNSDPVALLRTNMAKMKPLLAYDGGDVSAWQNTLRDKLQCLLRLDNMPFMSSAPECTVAFQKETPYGKIEKLYLLSESGYSIPTYLCIPVKPLLPKTTFICLQGHTTGMHISIAAVKDDQSREMDVTGDLDFGVQCMKLGIMALCIEQRGFGEANDKSKPDGSYCHNAAMLSLMCGKTLMGQRVYDVQRALDYLLTRDDVAADRIGIMGNSGGGTVALYATALSSRISCCIASCCFSSYKASLMSVFHCECNYVPDLLTYAEMGDVAALIAPRPLVIVNGAYDPLFAVEDSRKQFITVKQVYGNAGAVDKCRHLVCEGGHRFYAKDVWPVMLEMLFPGGHVCTSLL